MFPLSFVFLFSSPLIRTVLCISADYFTILKWPARIMKSCLTLWISDR